MNRNIIGIIAVMTMSGATIANAKTFTYTSQGDPVAASVGGTAGDGKPFGAQYATGNSDVVMEGGQKSKNSFKCISMTQPANNAIFPVHMMCDIAAPDGTFTSAWGCTPLGPQEMSCIGGLIGKTGAYANRRGSITGHTKDTKSVGTGQWLD